MFIITTPVLPAKRGLACVAWLGPLNWRFVWAGWAGPWLVQLAIHVSDYQLFTHDQDVHNELRKKIQEEFPEALISVQRSGGCLLP